MQKSEVSDSILRNRKRKNTAEIAAQIIVSFCAFFLIAVVISIALYIIIGGLPAFFKVGIKKILLHTIWKPTAENPQFGILSILLTSLVGTFFAVLIGVPIAIFSAIFLAETAPKKVVVFVKPAVELLAGIPSIIYGLVGVSLLNPLLFRLELAIFKNSKTHQFTGGANFIAAVLVLAIMILPTIITISEAAIQEVPYSIKSASIALGATKIQTIFKAILPAAKSGIATAVVLGVGRAVGEAMAIMLVSGNSVNFPLPFHSVRFLTTAIVSEMAYAQGTHRQVLFSIGMILFVVIMLITIVLNKILKKQDNKK